MNYHLTWYTNENVKLVQLRQNLNGRSDSMEVEDVRVSTVGYERPTGKWLDNFLLDRVSLVGTIKHSPKIVEGQNKFEVTEGTGTQIFLITSTVSWIVNSSLIILWVRKDVKTLDLDIKRCLYKFKYGTSRLIFIFLRKRRRNKRTHLENPFLSQVHGFPGSSRSVPRISLLRSSRSFWGHLPSTVYRKLVFRGRPLVSFLSPLAPSGPSGTWRHPRRGRWGLYFRWSWKLQSSIRCLLLHN